MGLGHSGGGVQPPRRPSPALARGRQTLQMATAAPSPQQQVTWVCAACTLINSGGTVCAACGSAGAASRKKREPMREPAIVLSDSDDDGGAFLLSAGRPAPAGPPGASGRRQRQRTAAGGGDPLLLGAAGEHCMQCRQLEFLPITCDACASCFCQQCAGFEQHNCPMAYAVQKLAAVCPLCQQVVPAGTDGRPDDEVDRHINSGCKKVAAAKSWHACSFGNCKAREIVQCSCKHCDRNFCLKHRAFSDHSCSHEQRARASAANRRGAATELLRTQRPDAAARTDGLLESLAARYQSPKLRGKVVVSIAEVAAHYSQVEDGCETKQKAWSCGYRNLQMLCAALLAGAERRMYGPALFGGAAFVPRVSDIQGWIEKAWADGFDPDGARHFGGALRGGKRC